jgi:hypothetical protein
VLDENFPEPILREAIETYVLDLELVSIRDFAPELTGEQVEDWQVILGLRQRGAQGLVTCDDAMLEVAQVVAVIEQTTFSVVTCRAAGDDAVKASGMLLTHLPAVGNRHNNDKPQVWRLHAPEQLPRKIGELKDSILEKSGVKVDDYHLSQETLQGPLFPSSGG